MNAIIKYIREVIGLEIEIRALAKATRSKLPMYLNQTYQWYEATLANNQCILVKINESNTFGIAQMQKQFNQLKSIIDITVIAVFDNLEAYNRKRLIEKKMPFIVPGKQLYIPEFFIDLREIGSDNSYF